MNLSFIASIGDNQGSKQRRESSRQKVRNEVQLRKMLEGHTCTKLVTSAMDMVKGRLKGYKA